MKKVCVWVLVMAFVCASVLAEELSPSAFVAARGLMVIDQNQMAAMAGGELLGGAADYSVCALVGGDSMGGIIWTDDVLYIATDPLAMFGQPSMDAKALGQVFINFCTAFPDFDIYSCGEDIAYIPNDQAREYINVVSDVWPVVCCNSMDEFLDSVRQYVGD